jgi:hypothetical protein
MTEQDYLWLVDNRALLYNSTRMTPQQGAMIFTIYNKLSPKYMAYTTCGSCIRTVISLLRQEYEKYQTKL